MQEAYIDLGKYSIDLIDIDGFQTESYNTNNIEEAEKKYQDFKEQLLKEETVELWKRGEFETLECLKYYLKDA